MKSEFQEVRKFEIISHIHIQRVIKKFWDWVSENYNLFLMAKNI
jgi:hypothetical protein